MSWENLLAFNAVLIAALASPGAALLYAMKTTVASGRAAGIATGIGLGTAAACWTLAALLGLESLFRLFPWTYTLLKIGGALYLIWLAIQTWRHARTALGESPTPHGRAVLSGLLVNFGNPKSVLFAAAVIVVVFPQGLTGPEIGLIVANHWVLEILFYTLIALLLGAPAARRRYLGLKPVLDRIAATLLGALGLRLLLER
ncbi:LysE family translocator [Thalassococcus sp. S3]|uniref:LysE family translocator n=1 Tax=Thalassococcus sp. S3 TaxID=2017482 RepID=UPI00102471D7|nr:LysE family transporter [Thalassococcus sp. S3]QBF32185.1 lysine transporter LysE [Thalassococcus sp. S3]